MSNQQYNFLQRLIRLGCRQHFTALAIAYALTGVATALPAKAQERGNDGGIEEVVVQATRSGRRAEEEAIRVELIDQDELKEKLEEQSGNISMLLNETAGLRMQVTSPSLGAASIRVQGLRGRYTQFLADGLPLYGGQTSSLGLLQIPPSDLGQVEIIKGAASALYGPSALGGVINLVSRRPGTEPQGEVVVNATSRDGQDLTAYAASPLSENWGVSLMGGLNRQSRQDLDHDGWVDIAGYQRWTLRPRAFWSGENGATTFVTFGAMHENRSGGTLPGYTVPDGAPFKETQHTNRLDGGLVTTVPISEVGTLEVRASGMAQDSRHYFGSVPEDDHRNTAFVETTFASRKDHGTNWLGGVAFQRDGFHSNAFPAFNYTYSDPGVFGQVEQDVLSDLTLEGSARLDVHNKFGTRFSPRLSMLYHPGPWSLRASFGGGFYAPTPFVEEIEAAGLLHLEPLRGLKAETAQTGSVDGGYTEGPFDAHVTVFASKIKDAARLIDTSAQSVQLINVPGASRTWGTELLLKYRLDPLTITGSYVHVDATEPNAPGPGRRAVPLTPRDTAGVTAMWEEHDKGKIGVEAFYTGPQELENNPYRSQGRPYFLLGLMGELIVGKAHLFINCENLLDVRQTKYDPLVLPRRAADGRWEVDEWAPLDGRVVNGGVRFLFGKE